MDNIISDIDKDLKINDVTSNVESTIKKRKPRVRKVEKIENSQLTMEELDKLEKEAVINLTEGLKAERDNTSWVRLALDFLKAKHPSYRDKKDQILPQEYKQFWEEVSK